MTAPLLVDRVPISSVRKDEKNARQHSKKNLEAIKASLAEFGQQKPIVVDRDGMVLAGNGTLDAALALGWTEIDITRSDLVGARAKAYAVADNRTAELAVWDDAMLAEALAEIEADEDFDSVCTGFDEAEIERAINKGTGAGGVDEDETPEPPAEPITKSGDLWLLGEHRLLCGDSTKAEDVGRVMAGEKAGLMVTDPPYGVKYEGGQANQEKRESLIGDECPDIFSPALGVAEKIMPVGAWYVWHAGRHAEPVYKAIRECGYEIRALIIWNKLKAHYGAPSAHYCQKHEPCLYAVRGNAGFVGASNEVTVWDIDQPSINEFHPTQKPVECMARAIRNHSAILVYDPFLGSGTTLIAAEQLGRRCFGLEIEPRYCDVIVKRWENLTGKKASHG